MEQTSIHIEPIGNVGVDEGQNRYQLIIDEDFRPALQGLGSCTHAIVLWWADQFNSLDDRYNNQVVELPYAPGVRTGVFANRSELRPNPIAITTSFILNVNEEAGIVDLAFIDAFDGTPILDIKPYLPMSDRVRDADYPEWLEGLPDCMEDAAKFFSDPDNIAAFS
jgi:tRNA (Thr-GGU) A37 N-methylase